MKNFIRSKIAYFKTFTTGQMILGLMLLIQFICLFLFNVLKLNDYMDPDAANLFSHMYKVVHERTYLIPGWIYTTTLELDCSLLLAAPIYAITRSVPVAVGITNLIYAVFFIHVWMKVLRKESLYSRLLFANLVLIPYQLGMLDYYNMMFFSGGQYLIKTLIPVILITCLAGGSMYARDYYSKYSDVTIEPTETFLFVFKCTELVPLEIGAEGGCFNGYYLYPVLQVGEYTILRVTS